MRVQASLEFLIILGAISLLSLSVIALYSSNIGKSSQLLGNTLSLLPRGMGNFSSAVASQNPQILVYLPENSTINSPNRMGIAAFGCDSGSVNISVSSQSLYFPQNSFHFGFNGLTTLDVPFTPLAVGFALASVNSTEYCGGIPENKSFTLSTYALGQASLPSGESPTAYIGDRTEYVIYRILPQGNVESLSEFSHCTYASMFGPTGIEQQCGTDKAWSYSVFSSYCYSTSNYYTATTCIVPSNSSYSVSSVNPSDYSLKYSIYLNLKYQGASISANLSNNSTSQVFSGSKRVGTANIVSAVNLAPLAESDFLSQSNKEQMLSQSTYSQYLQAKNNLYSTLSFYNQSYVSTDIQSSIESAVSSYIKASNKLINSTGTQNPQCIYLGSNYTCNASSPFSYQINVSLSGINWGNLSTSYLGSGINIVSR